MLVVGAGPIGLMAAGDLARRGVTVRIVERTTERSPLSKALVVHARTLEIMDVAGLAEQFVTRGYPAPGLNVGLGSIAKPISINMNVLDTRFPYMLVLPQAETEEILAGRLADQDVKVERGTELVGIEQDGSEVTATLRANGEDERVRARYLIGSDGAHSTVRRAVDLPFAGEQLEQLVLLGDVKADTEFVRSRITNLTSPRGFVSILPFLGDYVRVFAVDFAKQDRTRSDELSLADLQDTVNSISPTPIELSDPRWLTRFSAPSRQVRTTRVGDVFLAGDAAHAHSPAAGQGMNTGLQDVANLSWKLAMVLRGQAPAALLDSYDEERHPVHTRVRHATDRMFRSFVLRNPVAKLGRDVVARSLIPRSPVQRKLAENLSGIAVNYRDTHARRPSGVGSSPMERCSPATAFPMWSSGSRIEPVFGCTSCSATPGTHCSSSSAQVDSARNGSGSRWC